MPDPLLVCFNIPRAEFSPPSLKGVSWVCSPCHKSEQRLPLLAVPEGLSWAVLCPSGQGRAGQLGGTLVRLPSAWAGCSLWLELSQAAVSTLLECASFAQALLKCPSWFAAFALSLSTSATAATGFCVCAGSLRGTADFFLAFEA